MVHVNLVSTSKSKGRRTVGARCCRHVSRLVHVHVVVEAKEDGGSLHSWSLCIWRGWLACCYDLRRLRESIPAEVVASTTSLPSSSIPLFCPCADRF